MSADDRRLQKADVKLMIAYPIQYEPMNRIMQRLVRERVFGLVKFIESDNGQRVGKGFCDR